MTIVVLALIGVMVVLVTISPPRGTRQNGSTASVAPVPTPVGTQLSDPDAFDVSAELSTTPGAKAETVDAEIGDRVEITVAGGGADSVALGDLAVETVDADSPARFELLADTPGRYPIVLVDENRTLGTLEVR
jgi:hypothetical protein